MPAMGGLHGEVIHYESQIICIYAGGCHGRCFGAWRLYGRRWKKEENEKPVVVVLWHSYNAVAKGAFDDLVMEFNETVGMEQGIIVEPVGYGSSNELDDVLYASASHVIGSDPLPDIFHPTGQRVQAGRDRASGSSG